MPEHIADMGEYVVSNKPDVLTCIALGSCVGIGIHDPITGIGGMAHIMLPSSQGVDLAKMSNKNKFADVGLPAMLNELKSKGCRIERSVVKLAGGAHMFKGLGTPIQDIGKSNYENVKKILSSLNIRVTSEECGGDVGRTVRLYLDCGKFEIKTKDGIKEI